MIKLSPSSAYRWMECPPSADIPDEQIRQSSYAEEGTLAHACCECALNGINSVPSEATEEMIQYADDFKNYIYSLENFSECLMLTEKKLPMPKYVPSTNGTIDVAIFNCESGVLHIVDYKYGAGIRVSAIDNPQLKMYALAMLDYLQDNTHIKKVILTIYQPRIEDGITSQELTIQELLDWGENVLKPAARLAYEGKGELKAGHWCTFCPRRATCDKRAELALEVARNEFGVVPQALPNPEDIDPAKMALVLSRGRELSAWIDDVRKYALAKLLKGETVDGFKAVAGRRVRAWTSQEDAERACKEKGIDFYSQKPRSVADIEKQMGKKAFAELSDLVIYNTCAPTIAPLSDKRKAITGAAADFEVYEEQEEE